MSVCLLVILKQFKVKLADITISIMFDVSGSQSKDTVVDPNASFDLFIYMNSLKVRGMATLLCSLEEHAILS